MSLKTPLKKALLLLFDTCRGESLRLRMRVTENSRRSPSSALWHALRRKTHAGDVGRISKWTLPHLRTVRDEVMVQISG